MWSDAIIQVSLLYLMMMFVWSHVILILSVVPNTTVVMNNEFGFFGILF